MAIGPFLCSRAELACITRDRGGASEVANGLICGTVVERKIVEDGPDLSSGELRERAEGGGLVRGGASGQGDLLGRLKEKGDRELEWVCGRCPMVFSRGGE